MIYQSTVGATKLCDNLCNKNPYGNVSVICRKNVIGRSFFKSPVPFSRSRKHLLGLPSLCCSLLITVLDN